MDKSKLHSHNNSLPMSVHTLPLHDAIPGVHCAMCAIRTAGFIFRFRLTSHTFSNTILWTPVQLWQDNICLFLSMTGQQLTLFLTLFIIAIKPAGKQAFTPQCSHFLWQNFNKQWTAASLHVACVCEETKTISSTAVAWRRAVVSTVMNFRVL
jgi:hypothetical protein